MADTKDFAPFDRIGRCPRCNKMWGIAPHHTVPVCSECPFTELIVEFERVSHSVSSMIEQHSRDFSDADIKLLSDLKIKL